MRTPIGNTVQERIASILEPNWNCLEIGAGHGDTTKVLCKHTKFVTVIDPFEYIEGADRSYFDPYPRQVFFDNMRGIENWRLWQLRTGEILDTEWYFDFAFVDGLQDRVSVSVDLDFCNQCDVICVDDYDRPEVRRAVNDFIKSDGCKFTKTNREIYLWR